MNRFIKTFVDNSTKNVTDQANAYAKEEGLEIVSAQLAFSGSGHIYEMSVLTVVFEKVPKVRKPRKKPEEAMESVDS